MSPSLLLVLAACGSPDWTDADRQYADAVPADPHATVVGTPPTLGTVDTNLEDVNGRAIGVACATCHDGVADSDHESPHDVIDMDHGDLSCASCHAEDRSMLRLADGSELEMREAMGLCGQCHGPQLRDYEHGAHGGMQGYWDLDRGERQRSHCLSCHSAHEPAWSEVMPVHAPRDRFFGTDEGSH